MLTLQCKKEKILLPDRYIISLAIKTEIVKIEEK